MDSCICPFSNRSYLSKPSLDITPKATMNPAIPNPTIKLTSNVPIAEFDIVPNSGIKRNAVNIMIKADVEIKNEFSSFIWMFCIATIAPQIPNISQIIPLFIGIAAPIIEIIIIPRKKIVAKSYLAFFIEIYCYFSFKSLNVN